MKTPIPPQSIISERASIPLKSDGLSFKSTLSPTIAKSIVSITPPTSSSELPNEMYFDIDMMSDSTDAVKQPVGMSLLFIYKMSFHGHSNKKLPKPQGFGS